MARELAVGYVSLVPSAKNIGRKIAAEMGEPIEAAARQAGERAGDTVAKSMQQKLSGIGKAIGKAGLAATAGITLPIVAIGKQALDAASDLNESLSKAGVVFGDYTGTITALAAESAKKLGQSRAQVLEAAGTFGNLFVAIGIGQKAAADMSARLVELASDLASFNNVSPEEALDALRSGLVGETEPLRRFGVNMDDATLKAKALALGLGDFTKGVLPPAIKAQAAYAVILDQTKTAQGDFARTSDGAANKQRILTAQFDNAKATLGQALLPVFTKIATVVGGIAERFTNLSPRVQNMILIGGALAAALGPLISVIGAVATAVGFLFSPVGLAVAALAGLVAGVVIAYRESETFREIVDSVGRFIRDRIVPAVIDLWRIFKERIIPAVQEAGREFAEKLKPKLDELREAFERNKPEIQKVVDVVGDIIEKFRDFYVWAAEKVLPILGSIAGYVAGDFVDKIRIGIEIVGKLVDAFEKVVKVGKTIGGALGFDFGGGDKPKKFADGGYLRPGQFGIFNEKGPELAYGGRAGVSFLEAEATRRALTVPVPAAPAAAGAAVTLQVTAPHDASILAQANQAARSVSWLLSPSGSH